MMQPANNRQVSKSACLQIPWIQALLGPPDGVLAKLAVWLGLRLNASSRSHLEYVLRAKFLLLLAVNLKQRSLR